MQIFRGPTTYPTTNQSMAGISNAASVMGAHSLLEDMYGNEYVWGHVSAPSSPGFAQLVNITVSNLRQNIYIPNAPADAAVPSVPAELPRHVGGVLTIQSVPSGSTQHSRRWSAKARESWRS